VVQVFYQTGDYVNPQRSVLMAKKEKQSKTKASKKLGCRLIQWEQTVVKKGVVVCPECGKPAEHILGFFGNPCWGHKR
jgi:hypothetical protein